MNKLKDFYKALEKYRRPVEDVRERMNWCHLLTKHKGELHRFQVRYASFKVDNDEYDKSDTIVLDVVNWTMCAGTATLTLTEDTCGKWLIEEDEPTVGLLYVEE